MMNETRSERLYRISFGICFVVVAASVLPLVFLALFTEMASGSPVPRDILLRKYLLLTTLGSIFVYRWVPPLTAVLTWIDLGMILTGVFPCIEKGTASFLYQFTLDLFLFLAANIGCVMFFLWKRVQAAHEYSD